MTTLTATVPKPMIEIGGHPILEHNIDLLRNAGIRHVVINLHHIPEAITSYFGDGTPYGVNIEYSYERELLGTAGAAAAAADRLRAAETVVVIYGDNLSTIDLRAMLAFHASVDADFTLALYQRQDVSASGVAEISEDGRVTRFVEKPAEARGGGAWVNAGYYALKPRIIDSIPRDRPSDFGRDIIPSLLSSGSRVFGYRMAEKLWWIDTLTDYERTFAELSKGADAP